MKFSEINKMFSDAVSEWLAKGWVINAGSMGGSQGEIAKVDLTDGTKIIRILLDQFDGEFERAETRYYVFSGMRLVVGRVTDNIAPNSYSCLRIPWNQNLEVLSSVEFFELERVCGEKIYGTKAQAIAKQSESPV